MNNNLLFFIETGSGNGRSMADEAISIKENGTFNIHTVSSGRDQETGVLDSILKVGVENICLLELDEHHYFNSHRKQIREYVVENNIGFVHTQTNWELVLTWCAIMGLKNKPKIIYTIHAFRNNESFIKRNLTRFLIYFELFLFADRVITCSSFMYNNFKSLKYKMALLPLGVDKRCICHSFIAISDCLRIVFPGAFREGKGQDKLIKAFSLYLKESNDHESILFLPGDGKLKLKCERLAEQLGVKNQVVFPGRLQKDEMVDLFDQCNVLACTSKSETFSQILAEGYCLGKCIITRPVGIASDIIHSGYNGYIVDSEEQIKDILLILNDNKTLIIEMGRKNYNDRMRFSWERIIEQYSQICKSIVN